MKIAILHSANNGFFPRFYKALRSSIEKAGDKYVLIVPNSGCNKRNPQPGQRIWGTRFNWFIHHYLYKLVGLQDIFSICETVRLIKVLKEEKPDLIHLHVVNDQNMNIPMFVKYVNMYKIPVVWTMHDCRAFTGRCSYFDEIGCDRWKTGCGNCPQKQLYMPTWIDASHAEWKIRKKWHTEINNLTIVTPSTWLADFIKQSFFKEKALKVIYNGIDTSVFSKKTSLNIRKQYGISVEKKIVLGVSAFWESRKGSDYFAELARKLTDEYQIVMIGYLDNKTRINLPSKIIQIQQTTNVQEMAAWYQVASVFVNPTLADNFPTTNIESLAAGTPVVTFQTGGSPESIDSNSGIIVKKGDGKELLKAILEVCSNPDKFTEENCQMRARSFSTLQYDLYTNLYHSLVKK